MDLDHLEKMGRILKLNYSCGQLAETGMGYSIVSVILKDGRRFDQAVIVPPLLVGIRGWDSIPFLEDEIKEIVVTHDKWDWSRERWNQKSFG